MKHFAMALLTCLALTGCKEGATWTGFLTATEPLAVLGPDGDVSMEIPAGSTLEASLYQDPDRSWIFEFRDRELKRSVAVRVPYQSAGFRYDKLYHFDNLDQNFEVSVMASLEKVVTRTGRRLEYCYELKYICGWNWDSGEYKHTCEHKQVPGTREIQYRYVAENEILEGELLGFDGAILGSFELSRQLGHREQVIRRGSCEPATH